MNRIFDPSNEGNINMNRARRWVWNYNTFINNQAPDAWAQNPVCYTFAKDDIQQLLADRIDEVSGASIPSAGIRFYFGLYKPADPPAEGAADACYLQLFAVRCEAKVLYTGNHEITHNDVVALQPDTIRAFDQTMSSTPRALSPLNPAGYPDNDPKWSQQVYPWNQNPGYPIADGNKLHRHHILPYMIEYHKACQLNPDTGKLDGPIRKLEGQKTVKEMEEGQEVQYDFNILPEQWPRAYFFSRDDILNEFANASSELLDCNIRMYFGITDLFDSNETGQRPGMIKLMMIGAHFIDSGDSNADWLSLDGLENNRILDFSLPCPDMCGGRGYRMFDPASDL